MKLYIATLSGLPDYIVPTGIDLEYRPKDQLISISSHYDFFVGIKGKSFTLKEFFDVMGINEQDCINAFKQS